jgi:hypothetical protein
MLESLLVLVIWLIVIGLIFWLLSNAINRLPIEEPVRGVINVVLILIVVLFCVYLLIGFLPLHPLELRRP